MNRIVVGSGSNIEKKQGNKIIINLSSDVNLLINDVFFAEYEINVYNANSNILILKDAKDDSKYIINVNKGRVSFNNFSFSSKDTYILANLNSEHSRIDIYNSTIAFNKVKYDILVNHNNSKTISNVYNNGITKENGTIIYNVTSYAPSNIKEGVINQDSKIYTLNEINENRINPILLIDSFDVEARHAAFIGNYKEDALFYLMSRGLDRNEASNLLIIGSLIGILDICFDEKEKLKKKLNN